jgi:hypothetical protein
LVGAFFLSTILRWYLQRQNKALEELENEGSNLSPERLRMLMKRAEVTDLSMMQKGFRYLV